MDPIAKELGLFLYQHRNFGGKVVKDLSNKIVKLDDAVEFILLVNQQGQPAVNVVPIGSMDINPAIGLISTMSKDGPFYKAYYQATSNLKLS